MIEKEKANENVRLANETCFKKLDDEPTLDDLMEMFDSWNVHLIEVTAERTAGKC